MAAVLILVVLAVLRPGFPPGGPVALTFTVDVPDATPPEDAVFLEIEGVPVAQATAAYMEYESEAWKG